MPYVKKTVYAGSVIEVFKYHSSRYKSNSRTRSKNGNPTSEAVRKQNDKNATLGLGYKININFCDDDYHIVLTYRDEMEPDNFLLSQKQLQQFLKKLREIYKKAGIEFKYITVSGCKKNNYHHHIILKSIDLRLLREAWPYGMIRANFLYTKGDYKYLAVYFTSHTNKYVADPNFPLKKRYNGSKNLKKPIVKKEIIRANTWQNEPKPVKGYYIIKDSLDDGYNEVTGYPFMNYRMKKLE